MTSQEDRLRAVELVQGKTLLVLERLDEKMEKVERVLIGDGNGMKGHNVRLDRLEQAAAGLRRLFYGILVPVGLLCVKAVAGVLGTPDA